ncbi:MAG TPA: signal peptidase II [Devosia sp.]|nr:signal peptidase II [Devosia sp.]
MNRTGLRLSLALGLAAFALDRLHKHVQVEILDWPPGLFRPLTPFFDLGLVFNTGISYGLLESLPLWAIALVVATAMIALVVWWVRANTALIRAGLALCLGGALSNAADRALYGAVADFFHFHLGIGGIFDFVFNIADASISLGVLLLLLDFLGIGRAREPKAA